MSALSALPLGLALSVVIASATLAYAEDAEDAEDAEEAEEAANAATRSASKKHAWLADKLERQARLDEAVRQAQERELARRVGGKPDPVVNIFNTWTNETIAVAFDPKRHPGGTSAAKRRIASAKGSPDEVASWHLRCHFTNEPTAMDPRLFQVLVEAAHHFRIQRVEIISGFRAPKYNLTLRKKGRQVARNSHHTLGEAVDFRLPGISTPKLRNWARRLRLGGVGYYPSSGFVHVDVGAVRTWRGD